MSKRLGLGALAVLVATVTDANASAGETDSTEISLQSGVSVVAGSSPLLGLTDGDDDRSSKLIRFEEPHTGSAVLVGKLGRRFEDAEALAIQMDTVPRAYAVVDDKLVTIDLTTGAATAVHRLRERGITGIGFHPATGILYGVTRGNAIVSIEPTTGRTRTVARHILRRDECPEDLAFHPDGRAFIVAGYRIHEVNIATGRRLHKWTVRRLKNLKSLAWDPTGTVLYSAADRRRSTDLVVIDLMHSSAQFVSDRSSGFREINALAALAVPGQTQQTVGPGGGTLELPSVGEVTFAPGSLAVPTVVTLAVTRDSLTESVYDDGRVLFAGGVRTPFELRIILGSEQPQLPCSAVLIPPLGFVDSLPADSEIQIFAQILSTSDDDTVEIIDILPSESSAMGISVELPRYCFTAGRRTDGHFEAVLFLAYTSTRPISATGPALPGSHSMAGNECEGSSLGVPFDTDATRPCNGGPAQDPGPCVTSAFGSRIFDGNEEFHSGVDFRAREGTPIRAVSSGVIDRLGVGSGGAGKRITLRHTQGSAPGNGVTIYMHMQAFAPGLQVGSWVAEGDVIGFVGSTGPRSTGPHLHLGYVPNGRVFDENGLSDPLPCILTQLRIESISLAPGATILADQSTAINVTVGPSGATVLPGTRIEVLVRDRIVGARELTATGVVAVPVFFLNFWTATPTATMFRIVSNDIVLDTQTMSYNVAFNWGSSIRGPWAVDYDWTYRFASRVNPGQTALEHHTGSGYVGHRNYRVLPFPEHFIRTAWVNNYDFLYDGGSTSYLDFGVTASGLMRVLIQRDVGYSPPIPTNWDLRQYLKYAYFPQADGTFTFQGPASTEQNAGEVRLNLNRRGDYHTPEIQCHRTYTEETRTSESTVDFTVHLRRIPLEEWPPGEALSTLDAQVLQGAPPEPSVLSIINRGHGSTTFRYGMRRPGHVTLRIFDVRGRQVQTLVDAVQAGGTHEAQWDGRHLASGVYLYRLDADNMTTSGKFLRISDGTGR